MIEVQEASKKLSFMQKNILRMLLAHVEYIEEHGNDYAISDIHRWGVLWQPGKWYENWTASDRANFSRSLRRLEERSLVIRQNDWSGPPDVPGRRGNIRRSKDEPPAKRTTRVVLTDLGREVAKWLTKSNDWNVNHLCDKIDNGGEA